MATRTGVIYIGAGHPNDDGLVDPPGVDAWWFSEGARPIWLQGKDAPLPQRRGWLPRGPQSALRDGLTAIFLTRAREADEARLPDAVREGLQGRKVDFARLSDADYNAVVGEAQNRAAAFGGKLILSAFYGSALLAQFAAVEGWRVDIELLAPVATRLWSRWSGGTRVTGLLAGGAA